MKVRLNLTIEDRLLDKIKNYAAARKTSVSELVEEYFKTLAKPVKRKTILDVVENLPSHSISKNRDLKKSYYEEQAKKYGA